MLAQSIGDPDNLYEDDDDIKVSAEDRRTWKMLSKQDKAHVNATEKFQEEFELQARPLHISCMARSAERRHVLRAPGHPTGHVMAMRGAQVIDVNVTNKGTRSGGIQSFTAMVIVGNYNVRPTCQPEQPVWGTAVTGFTCRKPALMQSPVQSRRTCKETGQCDSPKHGFDLFSAKRHAGLPQISCCSSVVHPVPPICLRLPWMGDARGLKDRCLHAEWLPRTLISNVHGLSSSKAQQVCLRGDG